MEEWKDKRREKNKREGGSKRDGEEMEGRSQLNPLLLCNTYLDAQLGNNPMRLPNRMSTEPAGNKEGVGTQGLGGEDGKQLRATPIQISSSDIS